MRNINHNLISASAIQHWGLVYALFAEEVMVFNKIIRKKECLSLQRSTINFTKCSACVFTSEHHVRVLQGDQNKTEPTFRLEIF
jgi:hypothetical protein